MSNFKQVQDLTDKYLMEIYGRYPIQLVDGHDAVLVDSEGREYDDFLSGISVCNLGYSNENVIQAIKDAADKIIHTSNFFHIGPQAELAQIICENSFGDKVFFCNSGGEANEGALKLAKKRAYNKYGDKKDELIYLKHSFHGRTLSTLNLTDSERYLEGYWGRPDNFIVIDPGEKEEIRDAISEKTVAVFLEPIQGEGGVYPMDQDFMEELRDLADKYDVALVFDEIQCGMARSGKLWAYENYGIEPDIMTLAKGLANGVPIGAVVAKGDYAHTFKPGDHGTTFGGNPLATSTGLAVMNEMIDNNIAEGNGEKGKYFKEKLEDLNDKYDVCKEVRGMGLMLGLELEIPGADIVNEMLERGFIINCTRERVLRFLPPFVISKDQIDRLIKNLDEILYETK